MTLELAARAPLTTVLSGPAGGIAGTAWIANGAGLSKLLSFDVGGTSADICVVEDGAPHHAYEARIDHLPMLLRVFDIRTIGAGGGSIASSYGGLLKVGPKSAGAVPGPAAYGAGGSDATVTDAAVVLGMIGGAEFLDGRMPLDERAARDAVARVASDLGLTVVEAAAGIINVAVAKMVGSLREVTSERGLDPREFALLAFGGAGPLLGPIVAGEMGMATTVIPPSPALFSAWGMLTSDLQYDVSRSALLPLDHPEDIDEIRHVLGELRALAVEVLAERTGDATGRTELFNQVDVRYRGQEYGLSVDVDDEDGTETIGEKFATLHLLRHGHGIPEEMEVVAARVRGIVVLEKPQLASSGPGSGAGSGAENSPGLNPEPILTRDVYDFSSRTVRPTPVYRRSDLGAGVIVTGPVIVTEGTATCVVQGDQEVIVKQNLLLEVRTRANEGDEASPAAQASAAAQAAQAVQESGARD